MVQINEEPVHWAGFFMHIKKPAAILRAKYYNEKLLSEQVERLGQVIANHRKGSGDVIGKR